MPSIVSTQGDASWLSGDGTKTMVASVNFDWGIGDTLLPTVNDYPKLHKELVEDTHLGRQTM